MVAHVWQLKEHHPELTRTINSTNKHSKLKWAACGNQAVLFLKERQEIRLSYIISNVYSKSAKLMVVADRNSALTEKFTILQAN